MSQPTCTKLGFVFTIPAIMRCWPVKRQLKRAGGVTSATRQTIEIAMGRAISRGTPPAQEGITTAGAASNVRSGPRSALSYPGMIQRKVQIRPQSEIGSA